MARENIRVRLRSYDHGLLDKATGEIVRTAKKHGSKVAGPIFLPTSIRRYTVLRSPHADKKARDQFEMRMHKRLIDIIQPTAETVDSLMNVQLPYGVDVAIKFK